MLEIYIIYKLASSNVQHAKKKGFSGAPFAVITVLLWIFLEIVGAVIGVLATGADGYGFYIFAILGGALGGLISYLIVKALPDKTRTTGNMQPSQNVTGAEPQFYQTPFNTPPSNNPTENKPPQQS